MIARLTELLHCMVSKNRFVQHYKSFVVIGKRFSVLRNCDRFDCCGYVRWMNLTHLKIYRVLVYLLITFTDFFF